MKIKKLTVFLTTGILAVCAVPMSAGAEILKGDVNHDGNVDAIDAVAVMEYYAAISCNSYDEYTEEEHENFQIYGNVTKDQFGDDYVDPVDAAWILSVYAGNSTQISE